MHMSNFYLDILKDRLYTFKSDSVERRAAQTVIYEILQALSVIIAPILVFTSEEIWQYMPKKKKSAESIYLNEWPSLNESLTDDKLMNEWQILMDIRECVLKALEEKRAEGSIGNALEAKVLLFSQDDGVCGLLEKYKKDLKALFIVSQVAFSKSEAADNCIQCEKVKLYVKVDRADGKKCPRCWNYSTEIGKDKEHPMLCPRCLKAIA